MSCTFTAQNARRLTAHLDRGNTVYFQLRRPNAFDNDELMQKHIAAGKAIIIPGDATKEEDVRRAWEAASADGKAVDTCIFTVGE